MITLHSTNCPKCNVLKTKLNKANIEFEENLDVNKIMELGFKTAPILQVDEEYLNFNDAVKWINNHN